MKAFLSSLVRTITTHPTVVKLVHTFWQAFLAAWVVTGFGLNKLALLAALAAAFSAVKSVLVSLSESRS